MSLTWQKLIQGLCESLLDYEQKKSSWCYIYDLSSFKNKIKSKFRVSYIITKEFPKENKGKLLKHARDSKTHLP